MKGVVQRQHGEHACKLRGEMRIGKHEGKVQLIKHGRAGRRGGGGAKTSDMQTGSEFRVMAELRVWMRGRRHGVGQHRSDEQKR